MMKSKFSYSQRLSSFLLAFAVFASLFSGCAKKPQEPSASFPARLSDDGTRQIVKKAVNEIVKDITHAENPVDDGEISFSANWEDYLGDPETFVYGLIANQLGYKYDVFPAYVELLDGTPVYGFAYTDYTECYVAGDESSYCFEAGFIPCMGDLSIPQEDFDSGLTVYDLDYTDSKGSFMLAFGSEPFTEHCVVYGKYLQYGVDESGRIFYTASDYSRDICDETLGSLYSYDQSRFLYDIDVGAYKNVTGMPLYSQIDYDELEAEINRILEAQDYNFVTVDIESCAYLAQEAVTAHLLSLQEESFLGYKVADLVEAAKALDPLECYRLTANGLIEIDLKHTGDATTMTKWLVGTACVITTVVAMVGSVVFLECPPLSALSGSVAGTAIEIFMEVVIEGESLSSISWGKVVLAASAGAVSGYLGPYIYAQYTGLSYFAIDSTLDGFIGGIEYAARAWMDGENGTEVIKSFGYGFALGTALSAGFKAAGVVVEQIAKRVSPTIAKLTEKVFPKLTNRVSTLAKRVGESLNIVGESLNSLKKTADASIFHSEYISHKLAHKQLLNLTNDGPGILKRRSLNHLSNSDTILDINNQLITKNKLLELFDNADDDTVLAYIKRGDELIRIVKKNGMAGIVFEPDKYLTVDLPGGLINDRTGNMLKAVVEIKEKWLDDPSLIPESLAEAIRKSGIDLEDMLDEKLLSIIRQSDWVLHENIDMKTITLVTRALHDIKRGGISHMGGYALAKYLKGHFGMEFFDRFVSSAATGTVIAVI